MRKYSDETDSRWRGALHRCLHGRNIGLLTVFRSRGIRGRAARLRPYCERAAYIYVYLCGVRCYLAAYTKEREQERRVLVRDQKIKIRNEKIEGENAGFDVERCGELDARFCRRIFGRGNDRKFCIIVDDNL